MAKADLELFEPAQKPSLRADGVAIQGRAAGAGSGALVCFAALALTGTHGDWI